MLAVNHETAHYAGADCVMLGQRRASVCQRCVSGRQSVIVPALLLAVMQNEEAKGVGVGLTYLLLKHRYRGKSVNGTLFIVTTKMIWLLSGGCVRN